MFESIGGGAEAGSAPAAPAAPEIPAPAARALAIALVGVFCGQLLVGGTGVAALARSGALTPGDLARGHGWTLASATLLHASWIHLAANASFVWIVGGRVERLVGAARMGLVFFVGGLAGNVLSVALWPDVVSVGASGGAWGLLLADLLLAARPGLRGGLPALGTVATSARLLGLNALISLLPGINGVAHLGGGVGGALALLASHRGPRLAWAAPSALLAAGHAVALVVALAVGRPWALRAPPEATTERTVLLGMATTQVPAGLQLDEDGVRAGDTNRDALSLWFTLDEGVEDPIEAWRTELGLGPARRLPCPSGCDAAAAAGDAFTVVCSVQRYGDVTLATTALVSAEAGPDTLAWAERHVGGLRLTDHGGLALVGMAIERFDAGRPDDAIRVLEAIVDELPTSGVALNQLAWSLATHPDPDRRDGARAVALAERALALEPDRANWVDTLAAAQAEAGDLAAAIATQERAVALDPDAEALRASLEALRARAAAEVP